MANTSASSAPAYLSSDSRCLPGLSSCCWSAWPCTATRSSARYVSSDTGTEQPPAKARERPSADTVLDSTSVPSSSSPPPASSTCRATGPSGAVRSRPSTTARCAPGRTRAGSARPPNSRPSPVTTIVLPAPVSPVSTVKPGESSSSASSMTPSPLMRTSSSMTASSLPSAIPGEFGGVVPPGSHRPAPPARDRQPELGYQPVGNRPAVRPRPRTMHPRQQHRQRAPAHLDPRAGGQVKPTPPIAPHHGLACLGVPPVFFVTAALGEPPALVVTAVAAAARTFVH